MWTIKTAILGLALGFGLIGPVAAQDVTADTVVATVGGTDITVGHMIALRETLPEQYSQLPDETLFEAIIDQLVKQEALAQSVTSMSRMNALQLENQRRGILSSQALNGVAEAVTEADIQAAYDAAYADFTGETEFNASHILVETEDEAKALVVELAGGADFADLAKEKSTGPSGPNGGQLGWFGKGMMVAPFEEAVLSMAAGQVSEPVQTQFGWHVIKLNETRETAKPTVDETREQLMSQLQQNRINATVEEIEAKSEVVRADTSGIDPAILKDTGLIGN